MRVVRVPSISYAELLHLGACWLVKAVDEVIFAEMGMTAEALLEGAKQAA